MASKFAITEHKGFQMTFENGWTVSVQWGPGNYGSNHDANDYAAPQKERVYCASTAEVAAWDKNTKWFSFDSDTVKGYLSADEVAQFISEVSQFEEVK